MTRWMFARLITSLLLSPVLSLAQNAVPVPGSDPQALSLAMQSMASLTQATVVNDVTLVGTARWIAGSDAETGTATLLALGNGESRMDLALDNGTRTEIRDGSTGTPSGQWLAQGRSGLFAAHNCLTDAVWFFPVLGSLAAGPNVVLSYVGQETHNGQKVQHIQSYLYHPSLSPKSAVITQQLSTIDFFLDATTLLPSAITFNAYADDDIGTRIAIEV
jgi:hypothetical protein